MANANKLNGFTAVGYLNGADWDGRGRVYTIPSANTNALAVGDPVTLIAGADSTYYMPCIDRGAAGAICVGVILAISKNARGLGPWVDPTNLNNILYRPATATVAYYALVADDPNIIFEAQEQASGGAGTNFSYTAANKNANFSVALDPPGYPPYVSQAFIDNGTAAATTSTYNLKLLGLKQSIDNASGAYQRWWCLLNNHYYRTGVVGI
jgi:hypothetical protein